MEKWNTHGRSINPVLLFTNWKKIANISTNASKNSIPSSLIIVLYYYASLTI